MKKIKCARCKKYITGKAKVDTYRRQLGSKAINKVDYYCENCFSKLNQERAQNEYKKQKTAHKKAVGRKIRRRT